MRQARLAAASAAMLLSATLPSAAVGQGGTPLYLYRGLPYGSEAAFSPLTAILHSGYYNFQIDNRGDDPFALPYGVGFDNVMENLLDPFGAISSYGWGRFLTTELLPNPSKESAQWVPNYLGHVIGEGIAFRMSLEWYAYHGFRYPTVLAIANAVGGALLNEAVENGDYRGVNVDPIADFYIFNPIAMVLFANGSTTRFLTRTLGLSYWPQQAAIDPINGTLQNVGYRTVFRFMPPRWPVGAFAVYGVVSVAGPAIRLGRERTLLIGAGAAATDLVEVADAPDSLRIITATTGPAAAVFLDRRRSLLASLTITPKKLDKVALSVYPGWLGPKGFRPGFTLSLNEVDGLKFSIHAAKVPFGLGFHTGR